MKQHLSHFNRTHFNLVEQPWIPCIMPGGARTVKNLREVLTQAHEIREVHDPSPLVTVALHRLLFAVLHRCFGPKRIKDWLPLWRQKQWDAARIDDYLKRWQHRFDLFDPERPFGQVLRMDVKEDTIAALLLETASGNNATLFDHGKVEGADSLPPERAACYLLAHQAFAPGGGVSKPFNRTDSPLTRGMSVLVYGENLFETLALNLASEDHWTTGFPSSPDDAPCWEWEEIPAPEKGGRMPKGRLDYLSWQSRRIHLIAEGSPLRVVRCQIQQNYCLPPEPRPWDLFKRYRYNDEQGRYPAKMLAERALWRDTHALLSLRAGESERPELLHWLGEIDLYREEGEIDAQPQYPLLIYGMGADQAKIEFWRAERLPLPLAYLRDEYLLELLGNALEMAQRAAYALRDGVRTLAEELLQRSKTPDVENLTKQLSVEPFFWSQLERPFRGFLEKLPGEQQTAAIDQWEADLKEKAHAAFATLWQQLDTSARALQALSEAESKFRMGLHKALSLREKEVFA